MIPLLLTRWKVPLGIAAALAFLGLALAANHYRHAYHAEKALRKADRAAYGAAQAQATLAAQRALEATEARYRREADEVDKEYAGALESADAAVRRYLDTHRMRTKAAACPASSAPASAEDHGAEVPAPVPALALMDEADVRAAAEWQVYGERCRAFVIGLGE